MNVPNSDIDIRPMLSNLQFYIGQTGKTEHNPLLDFSLLYEHAELGVRFTLSGLDRINESSTLNWTNSMRIDIVNLRK
ncbi:hypothetical protein PCL99_07700 [Staphylococcus aureus]|nr:hypothetical protein PCL99_07700 [Staphylococcus aureus]